MMLAWGCSCSYLSQSLSLSSSFKRFVWKREPGQKDIKKPSRSVTSAYNSYLGRRFLSPVFSPLFLCYRRTVFLLRGRQTSAVCLRVHLAPALPLRPTDADGHHKCLKRTFSVNGHQELKLQIRERGHCRRVPGSRDLLLC